MKKIFSLLGCVIAIGGYRAFPALAHTEAGDIKSLEKRIEQIEDAVTRTVENQRWYERIRISWLLEIEAVYESVDASDSNTGNARSGDVDLATVELAVDAKIAPRIDGHVLIKYEEDEVFVDEGFISLSGPESFSVSFFAGGNTFPSDTSTVILSPTRRSCRWAKPTKAPWWAGTGSPAE